MLSILNKTRWLVVVSIEVTNGWSKHLFCHSMVFFFVSYYEARESESERQRDDDMMMMMILVVVIWWCLTTLLTISNVRVMWNIFSYEMKMKWRWNEWMKGITRKEKIAVNWSQPGSCKWRILSSYGRR